MALKLVIGKPISLAELAKTIRAIIDRRSRPATPAAGNP